MNTYCIAGPQDLTSKEFYAHFIPFIDAAMAEGASFVVGDDPCGTDSRARRYLFTNGCANRLTVYLLPGRKHPYVALSKERLIACLGDDDRDRRMCLDSN